MSVYAYAHHKTQPALRTSCQVAFFRSATGRTRTTRRTTRGKTLTNLLSLSTRTRLRHGKLAEKGAATDYVMTVTAERHESDLNFTGKTGHNITMSISSQPKFSKSLSHLAHLLRSRPHRRWCHPPPSTSSGSGTSSSAASSASVCPSSPPTCPSVSA